MPTESVARRASANSVGEGGDDVRVDHGFPVFERAPVGASLMRAYLHEDASDSAVSRGFDAVISRERTTTAELLGYLASFDARKLYLPAGYPSMYAYCVEKLHFPEDTAVRRIQAARLAREFPALFPALAEGRIHVTGLLMLAPYLTSQNVDEWIEVTTYKSRSGVQEILAARFPKPALLVDAVISPVRLPPPAPVRVMTTPAPQGPPRATAIPVAPSQFDLHVRIDQSTHDKLRRAQELLSHAVPSGHLAQVLDRALDALLAKLEKRKFAATDKPRRPRASARARHTPARVKRAVWTRDQGQCAFVSQDGHRCQARRFLEYDHVDPVARGGAATVDRMRLRCRGHNQFEAEKVFGTRFMHEKRRLHRLKRHRLEEELLPGLRGLGTGLAEARHAIERSGALQYSSLEESMRAALRFLGPKGARMVPMTA